MPGYATITADDLYERLKNIDVDNPLCTYTKERCKRLSPLIEKISGLKQEKNALLLAHSYTHPDIVYGVADHVGDSYGLAKEARKTDADIIVFAAVRFMAETAKILNPTKVVIDPNPNGGCSLADSISADEVYRLRESYPHHTFVCYINTTAAVKAACDVCVTSSNCYKIIERIPNDKIYFLPDRLMALNIIHHLKEQKIDKQLLYYHGTCYVHEEFSPSQIDALKAQHSDVVVLADPECRPDVASRADLIASTTGLLDHVKKHHTPDKRFLLLTECGIASRLRVECPEARLLGTCHMCKYMRSNHLEHIAAALESPRREQIVDIQPEILQDAYLTLEKMFTYTEG